MIPRLARAFAALGVWTAATVGPLDTWFEGPRDRDRLPASLTEASGLARDDRGGLWVHDDERGVIARLEEGSGDIVERRVLGPEPVVGDFEGLAWDGRRFHLVTSTGTLVSFEPGDDESVHRWSMRRTGADRVCEVEGLATAPGRQGLVLACKTVYDDRWRGHLVVLDVALPDDDDDLDRPPLPVHARLVVPPSALEAAGLDPDLSPSGLTRSPDGKGWLVVAARQGVLIHLSDEGAVVDHAELPSGHPQAEGIALEGSHVLTLVDEGGDGRARITRYTRPDTSPP